MLVVLGLVVELVLLDVLDVVDIVNVVGALELIEVLKELGALEVLEVLAYNREFRAEVLGKPTEGSALNGMVLLELLEKNGEVKTSELDRRMVCVFVTCYGHVNSDNDGSSSWSVRNRAGKGVAERSIHGMKSSSTE